MPATSDDDTGRMSDTVSIASERSFKRKVSPTMTSPKGSSSRNQSRSNMDLGCCSGKEKKQKKMPPNRMIQQKLLKLLANTFKKSQQFSQKK